MHVGHIRSTILGDCLARTLRLLGHQVITDNHLGDWGTQFGKLILGWKQHLNRSALQTDSIGEMERLYKQVNAACETDHAILEQARQELVRLQGGDQENLGIWRESRGAIAVFFDDIPQLKDNPALIQKSDGAFNYTTTDLATLAYRLENWRPDEIIYVTGAPQQLHFQQLLAIFRRWHPEAKIHLAHVWFGSILGQDGRPFKTRSGETIRLADLLDEAEDRAFKVVSEKNPDLPEDQRRQIARIVGIGAVKYADLLPNRQTDYVFIWDKLLALNGNTAPYLQYAYTRIRSIFRKADLGQHNPPVSEAPVTASLDLSEPAEIALARHLLNFGLVLNTAAEDYRPNLLCNYLYELAGRFTNFYEHCQVLKSQGAIRATRLLLCNLTAQVLKQGLEILGIDT